MSYLLMITAGAYPHKRAQLYWRFAEQSYDADAVRAINKAIAAKLQGDKAERNAANPARA